MLRQGHWAQVVLASQEDRAHARTLSSVRNKAPDPRKRGLPRLV